MILDADFDEYWYDDGTLTKSVGIISDVYPPTCVELFDLEKRTFVIREFESLIKKQTESYFKAK